MNSSSKVPWHECHCHNSICKKEDISEYTRVASHMAIRVNIHECGDNNVK